MRRTLDLVVVVVDAYDVDACEFNHFARGTADAAADVEDELFFGEVHAVGEVVLVAGDGLSEWFVFGEAAEVEAAAPAVFVEVGCEVVVAGKKKKKKI